jgi:hypothetical protein
MISGISAFLRKRAFHRWQFPFGKSFCLRARYGFRKFWMRRHAFVDRGAAYTDEPSERAQRIS